MEKQRYNWNAVIATVALLTEEPGIGNEISGDGFCVKRTEAGFCIDIERYDSDGDVPVDAPIPETPDSGGAVVETPSVPAAADDTPTPVETGQGTPETPAVATGQGTPETPAVPTGQ